MIVRCFQTASTNIACSRANRLNPDPIHGPNLDLMEASPEQTLTRRQRSAFAKAKNAAEIVLKRRMRVLHLAREAYTKLAGEQDAMTRVKNDLLLMLRLSRAWALREYRTIPWKSLLYIIAAIVYFVNPVDLIPDVLAGLGFIDDVAVIAAVVRAIRNDLDAFHDWEQEQLRGVISSSRNVPASGQTHKEIA